MIHPTVQIFGNKFRSGRNVRIDCFCVITGNVEIGDHVHISCGVYLYGNSGKITISSLANIGAGSILHTATDDFTEGYLSGTQVPDEFRKITAGDILVEECAAVATRCLILPGVTLGRGCTVGAMTLVKHDVAPYAIVVGPNQRVIGYKNRDRLEMLAAKMKATSETWRPQ